MKRILIALSAIVLLTASAHAQATEDSVKTVVRQLFDGMIKSDASLIESAFADSAILQSVGVNQGNTVIENDKVSEFAKLISTLKKGAADEQIVFETIRIDGALAMVWAPYKFYYEGKFSHCGVDCFELVRVNGTWKIQYLIDTRRKQPCD